MSQLFNSKHNEVLNNQQAPYTLKFPINPNNGHQFRQYEIDYNLYINQREIYKWRQTIHHPIIKIISINQNIEKKRVSITCQNMICSLDEIQVMKIQEIIYCMSEMLLGYQSILIKLGFVCVEEKMIGLNNKGEILLWVNENPVKNTPDSIKLFYQQDILNRIVSIIQQKSITQNKIFFDEIKQVPKTFSCYLDFLMGFKMKHKLKIVPKILVNMKNKVTTEINQHNNNNYCVKQTSKQQKRYRKKSVNNNVNKLPLQHNQHYQHRHSLTPLITSTSVNYIPTIICENKQLGSFNDIKIINNNINNSQSQSQFIGINRLQSEQQFRRLPSAKTTSIIYAVNNNNSTNVIMGNDNNNNMKNLQYQFNQIHSNINTQQQSNITNINTNQQSNNNIQQTNNNIRNINTNQQSIKSSSKINFSYSQKRNDQLFTPRQSTFLRQYTSDRRLPTLTKIQSQTNHIREFTLMDDKRQLNQKMSKSTHTIKNNIIKKSSILNRRIVPSYNIIYNPINDSITLQNQLQLKKSILSDLSQKTFKSQQQQYDTMIPVSQRCQNKTSMTTNHRSAGSQSYQSIGKCSDIKNNVNNLMTNSNNDDGLDSLGRRNNNMFASNSSHRVTYSIVKDSLVENQTVKNTKSILINNSQHLIMNNNSQQKLMMNNSQQLMMDQHKQQQQLSYPNIKGTLTTSLFARQPLRQTTMMNNSQQKIQQPNSTMYTFGGLIMPQLQQNKQQQQNNYNIGKGESQQLCFKLKSNNNKLISTQISQQQVPIPKTITNLLPKIIRSSTIVTNNQHQYQQKTKQQPKCQQIKQQSKSLPIQQTKIKLSTTSVKSIQQLYKNINSKSQKKSIIILNNNNNNDYNNEQQKQRNIQRQYRKEQQQYRIHLSPIAKQQPPITPIKQSNVIYHSDNNNKNNNIQINNNNKFKKNHLQYLLSPTINHNNLKYSQYQQEQQQLHTIQKQQKQQQQFDYNQWRGITGLLNESNIHQLKQSIHCGPQIRTPLNIKLQLLDKFGRQIGHSILPSTPNNFMSSTPNGFANSCVRSICIDQQ